MITKNPVFCLLIFFLLFSGSFFSSASATPPAKIVSGIASNIASALFKWLWSLKPDTKIGQAVSSRSMVKYEGGYTVETVFDGSKLGIEPHSVEVTPSGELLILDSENSNIHKVSTPLSRYSRPKLVAGSSEGYFGHVDGKPRESRMNHPKGLAVDDRGNVYVADTMNMAIRKISDAGVVTIAGGNWARGTGHIDGPSDNAKFSDDFDVMYVASSCSILVIDRGNQAIREIQLHEDDCSSYQYDSEHHLGLAVLGAAVFFGFMLALLQRRVCAIFSSQSDPRQVLHATSLPPSAYPKSVKSVRPPLIPPEDEHEKEEEGLFGSLGKLLIKSGTTVFQIFGFSSTSKTKPPHPHLQMNYQQPPQFSNTWPMQETFVIPHQDAPPSLDTRKPYPFMTNNNSEPAERPRPSKQTRYLYSGQNIEHLNEQQQQQMQQLQQQQRNRQQHHQKHYSSEPQTYYEEKRETTNEVVFGAVQEQDGKRGAVVIKAVDYSNHPNYGNPNVRSRYNYMGYAYGTYS